MFYAGHSAKSADGRLHLKTHTPLTHRSRSGLTKPLSRQCGNLSSSKLTCNLSARIPPQSPQLAELLLTDPDIKSGISVRELISTLKKKEAQAGNDWSNILPKSSQARKKPPFYSETLCKVYSTLRHCVKSILLQTLCKVYSTADIV